MNKPFHGYTEVRHGESRVNPLRRLRMKLLLSSFDGRAGDIYRAVHWLKDNEFFFTEYAREFFYETDRLLKQAKIRSIRRLIVFSSYQDIRSKKSLAIIKFHTFTAGYDYRLISSECYDSQLKKSNLHPRIDFGVYGGKRVFRARTDRPDYVIGTWSNNITEVTKYLYFFETCWNNSAAFQLPPSAGRDDEQELVTPNDLFSLALS